MHAAKIPADSRLIEKCEWRLASVLERACRGIGLRYHGDGSRGRETVTSWAAPMTPTLAEGIRDEGKSRVRDIRLPLLWSEPHHPPRGACSRHPSTDSNPVPLTTIQGSDPDRHWDIVPADPAHRRRGDSDGTYSLAEGIRSVPSGLPGDGC